MAGEGVTHLISFCSFHQMSLTCLKTLKEFCASLIHMLAKEIASVLHQHLRKFGNVGTVVCHECLLAMGRGAWRGEGDTFANLTRWAKSSLLFRHDRGDKVICVNWTRRQDGRSHLRQLCLDNIVMCVSQEITVKWPCLSIARKDCSTL